MARNNSVKVLGEGQEGRFHNKSKHTRVELMDDGAPAVLDQSLVRGGVRLELAEESLWFHKSKKCKM